MNDLAVVTATLRWPGWSRCVASWFNDSAGPYVGRVYYGLPILEAYQRGFEDSREPILGFVHDDVICMEHGWDQRILCEFDDEKVGLVGLGGALGLGDLDIYKKPYELPQLARHTFMSNMVDAETHGSRFTRETDVSCLDGFAMFVRREVLYNSQDWGWPHGTPLGYFMYDAWLSCEVRRQGYRTRLVGVKCNHLGGQSTGLGPRMDGTDFENAHRYIYDTCRDVLPMRV